MKYDDTSLKIWIASMTAPYSKKGIDVLHIIPYEEFRSLRDSGQKKKDVKELIKRRVAQWKSSQ